MQDVRHTLYAVISFRLFASLTTVEAVSVMKRCIESLPWKKYVTLGLIAAPEGEAHFTHATGQHGPLLQALHYMVENVWHFDECHAIRVGKGCKTVAAMPQSTHSTLLFWLNCRSSDPLIQSTEGTYLRMPDIIGDNWERASFIQFVHNSTNPSGLCDSVDATGYRGLREHNSPGDP